ncbi:MAG: CRISPR-associated endonuclease Cas2 [Chloroflexi bacterium]|nr:CRISPR-associated endonuclease Cas2 [Chloroflexota bacterium]
MEFLVTYDVATDTAEGRRRLRKVAQICEGYGQRVQKSVFECTLNPADMEKLKHRLVRTIDLKEDSLRIYRLREPRQQFVETIGVKPEFDLHEPLTV